MFQDLLYLQLFQNFYLTLTNDFNFRVSIWTLRYNIIIHTYKHNKAKFRMIMSERGTRAKLVGFI